ncbi:Disease resistance protein RPS5 [Acorus gramineus]|uniref:Disease resistance protein RPS5 n=1 Tax=Acorus gramineus TaxID=55184 RepID=A0AAV9A0E5_ACOGR|nr:Disease resistance protein RPS5 [Acorus gramineus]
MERTNQVFVWLDTVRSLKESYDSIEDDIKSTCNCVGDCYLHCSPSEEDGKRAAALLKKVREATTERSNLKKLVEPIPGLPSVETNSPLKEALNELRSIFYEKHKAGVIGVCGMGGIGKTTLLKFFEAELRHRPGDFKTIIFVVVSKEPNAQKIQKEIGEKLGIFFSEGGSIEDRATKVSAALHDNKFVLLLDDVWDGIKLKNILTHIGVPFPNEENKCKFILTSRSAGACNKMGASDHKVKVGYLKSDEAWTLFKKNVGEMTINSHPDIQVQAETMAKKCGGLPLALMVIGSAMASKTTIQEWKHAASSMEELRTDKIEGMEVELLSSLKLSYDSLPDDTIKECFLYCCLYPEDYEINKEELVDYWVGEGFFDDEYGDEIDKARGEGHSIIGILKGAHLLETGHSSDSYVRMHDVIRDMALWISGKREVKFLIRAGLGLKEAPEPQKWSGNKRISLMDNDIKNLPNLISDCPNLSTLLIRYNRNLSGKVSSGFFQSMTNLRVLDLSWTNIESLPIELGWLTGLRYLNLSDTDKLDSIPVGAHVALQNLRQLRIIGCSVLKHFSCIRHLRCLESVEIIKCNEMKKLIDGEDGVVEDEASTLALSFPKLKLIELLDLPKLESICEHPLLFPSLKKLSVSDCPHLKKLPLEINSAPDLKEIKGEQEWWDGLVWDDELIKQKFVTVLRS